MATTGQNFAMWAGDDIELDAAILDDNGAPLNLTGATLRWGLAALATPGLALVRKDSIAGGIAITNAAGGLATVAIGGADTETLNGRYLHQLQVTDGSGETATLAVGLVTINPSMF